MWFQPPAVCISLRMRVEINSIGANLNEDPTGEETVLTLRYIARSFEPEPVTVAVIGIVIIVDDTLVGKGLDHFLRVVAMQTSMIKTTSTKTLETRQR